MKDEREYFRKEVDDGIDRAAEYTKMGLDIVKSCLGKFGKIAKDEIIDLTKVLKDSAQEMAAGLEEVWDELTSVEELTLQDITKFFVTKKAEYNDPRIAKGAVLRNKVREVYILTYLFLDANNEIIWSSGKEDGKDYGQLVRARSLNDELQQIFGENDLVIFE